MLNKDRLGQLYRIITQKLRSLFYFNNSSDNNAFGKAQNLLLNVPYEEAAPDDCGIGCIAMVLKYRGIDVPDVKELSAKYKTPEYYIDELGWKHDGLIAILQQFGLVAYKCKNQSMNQILRNIQSNRPVIVSLRVPEIDNLSPEGLYLPRVVSRGFTGHLCVIVGVQNENVLLHDPRNIDKYSKFVEVPFLDFNRIFTGRGIVTA